jgi:endonuclease YncB( thermonuclease family)
MKRTEIILLILFVSSGIFYYMWASSLLNISNVNVKRIIDGDTIELDNDIHVRLLGINTPEKGMLNSELAVEYLKYKIFNKTVKIQKTGNDKYGRILAYVFLDNKNINEELLKKGYAHLYYYDKDKYYNDFADAEKYARENSLGIWQKSDNYECINLVELDYYDVGEENETLILSNICNETINVTIKDDATHIYVREIKTGIYTEHFSNIFNDDGDSLYIWDNYGLVEFYRY